MITNTNQGWEALKTFSHNLSVAKNTLNYSLRLDAAFQENSETLNESTICGFTDNLANSIWKDMDTFNFDFNFFGYKGICHKDKKSGKLINEDLSGLHIKTGFWMHILKQDAIIFAFDRLRKLICESCPITQYERIIYSNYTQSSVEDPLFGRQNHGFDYLSTEEKSKPAYINISVEDSCPKITERNSELRKNLDSVLISAHASNFKRKITALDKQLKSAGIDVSLLRLTSTINSDPENGSLFSLFEFYNFLVKRDAYPPYPSTGILPIINAHNSEKTFSKREFKNYISSVDSLLGYVNPFFLSSIYTKAKYDLSEKMMTSDKIYLMNQIEKIFGLLSIDCIYKNIIPTKGEVYDLCDQSSINMLSACLCLPNVFTRQYILQMSIDTITKHFDYDFGDSDFFTQKMYNPNSLASFSHTRNSRLKDFAKLENWKNQYKLFMDYLVQVLFPVYENYFFCVFWEQVRSQQPEDNNADANTAINMYTLLRDYLNMPDTAKSLFDIENIIINQPPKWNGFRTDKIIHPNFSKEYQKNEVDVRLYKQCITAHSLVSKKTPVPDFISPEYFESLSSTLKKSVQNQYILEPCVQR